MKPTLEQPVSPVPERPSLASQSSLSQRFSRRVSTRVAATILAVTAIGTRTAEAQTIPTATFGADVNATRVGNQSAVQMIRGGAPNHIRMWYSAFSGNQYTSAVKDIFVEGDEAHRIILRSPICENVNGAYPPLGGSSGVYFEDDRGDGKTNKILFGGLNPDGFFLNGSSIWDFDNPNCNIQPAEVSDDNGKLIMVSDNNPFYFTRGDKGDVWDLGAIANLAGIDQCQSLRSKIAAIPNGQNPYTTTPYILDEQESVPAHEDFVARTDELSAIRRRASIYSSDGRSYLYSRFPGGPYKKPLGVDAVTRTWTPEPAGTVVGEDDIGSVQSGITVTLPGGRKVTVFVTDTPTGLAAFALERDASAAVETFREVPVTVNDVITTTLPDTDGDGVSDIEMGGTPLDNCPNRANPDQTDVNQDMIGDACQTDCGTQFPGKPATNVNGSGLRICTSELPGYTHAFSFEDGSTLHSNGDVVLDTDAVVVQPGQTLRYIHSTGEGLPSINARTIRIADGNSFLLQIVETTKLDGTPGQITLNRQDETLTQLPPVVFTGPTAGIQSYGPSFGVVLGLGGTDVIVIAGTENIPRPVVVDAGTGEDAGAEDGGLDSDSGADSGVTDLDGGTPDASGSDAGTLTVDGGATQPDAGNDHVDAGQEKRDAGEVVTPPIKIPSCDGCAGAATSAEAIFIVLAAAAAVRRRKEQLEAVRVEEKVGA